jgi:hypothetical protein
VDQLLQFLAGKFPAEPKHQAWYLAHGGDSLGNLAGSWKVDLERESSPPFLFAVKSERKDSALQPEWGKPPCLPNRPRLIVARGRKQKRQHPPGIQEIIGLKKGNLWQFLAKNKEAFMKSLRTLSPAVFLVLALLGACFSTGTASGQDSKGRSSS